MTSPPRYPGLRNSILAFRRRCTRSGRSFSFSINLVLALVPLFVSHAAHSLPDAGIRIRNGGVRSMRSFRNIRKRSLDHDRRRTDARAHGRNSRPARSLPSARDFFRHRDAREKISAADRKDSRARPPNCEPHTSRIRANFLVRVGVENFRGDRWLQRGARARIATQPVVFSRPGRATKIFSSIPSCGVAGCCLIGWTARGFDTGKRPPEQLRRALSSRRVRARSCCCTKDTRSSADPNTHPSLHRTNAARPERNRLQLRHSGDRDSCARMPPESKEMIIERASLPREVSRRGQTR